MKSTENIMRELRESGEISEEMVREVPIDVLEKHINTEKIAEKMVRVWDFMSKESEDLNTPELIYFGAMVHNGLSNEMADWLKQVIEYKGKSLSNVIQFKDRQ